MTKRALLVGLNNYEHEQDLTCCVDDAMAMAEMLGRNADGSLNYECLLLTSDRVRVTEVELRAKLQQLFSDIRGGEVMFYFSGHGAALETGGYLITQDGRLDKGGFPMSELLEMANESGVSSILMILDCCHSGMIGSDQADSQVTLGEGVTILTASTSQQESQEGLEHSLFTELVLGALDGGAADVRGQVSAASLYAYVEQALGSWQQRPMYKSNARRLNPIRHCEADVSDKVLRQLPRLFVSPDMQLQMDPTFEHSEPGSKKENIEKFNLFKKLRNARLLKTTDGKDLYFAALDSGAVMLTPLGKFYWQQVTNNRI